MRGGERRERDGRRGEYRQHRRNSPLVVTVTVTSSTILAQTANCGLFTCVCVKSWTCYRKSRTCHPRFNYTGIVELVLLPLGHLVKNSVPFPTLVEE